MLVSGRGLDGWPRTRLAWQTALPPGSEASGLVRALSGTPTVFGFDPQDHSETHRQSVDVGREIIRGLHEDPYLRELPVDQVLNELANTDGGPLIYNGREEEQRSFDAPCRRHHSFLYSLRGALAKIRLVLSKHRV